MRRALVLSEESFGPDHPNVAIDLNNLAQLLKATNRLAEAEPSMRRAVEIWTASLGPDHPNTQTGIENYLDIAAALKGAGVETLAKELRGRSEPPARRGLFARMFGRR